jgi:2-amino-4-hydroxy-6-hydroxymethyldihydropteridine diphosphokinase
MWKWSLSVPVRHEAVYVAIGSNVGDRAGHLAFARRRLAALPHTRIVAESTIEETAPLGPVAQPPFLNQMVLIETALSPVELLDACLAIEQEAGRVRRERWGPRTLDLDIVRFGDRVMATERLTVPHPELSNRPFWQRELEELSAHVR